jgi:hypothetical protein
MKLTTIILFGLGIIMANIIIWGGTIWFACWCFKYVVIG